MNAPISIYTEMTPNPVTMKFVLNFLLIDEQGTSIEFRTKEKAEISPLAKKIFELPYVTGIFITSNFITITRNESCEWFEIVPEMKELIKAKLTLKEPLLTSDFVEEASEVPINVSGDIEQKIIKILDEYIRPAVEGDGGAIHFKSFENGEVTVTLKGSCHGCPSTNTTLKMGIQNLLREMLPEVKNVITDSE